MDRARAALLLAQFERAVIDHGDLGTIPLFSPDAQEQRHINATRRNIKAQYTKARNRLLKALLNPEQPFVLTTPTQEN